MKYKKSKQQQIKEAKNAKLREQYKNYQKWMKKNGVSIEQAPKNFTQFKQLRKSMSLTQIKQVTRYKSTTETWRAFQESYKEVYGKYAPNAKRDMSTQEMAELIKDDIRNYYRNLKANGLTSQEAKMEISAFYFGS